MGTQESQGGSNTTIQMGNIARGKIGFDHTPGPWKHVVIPDICYGAELTGSIYSGKKRVCGEMLDDVIDRREAVANIRLVTAAPAILETLATVYKMLESGVCDSNTLTKLTEMIREAIWIATGS